MTTVKLRDIRVREGFNSRAVLPEIPKLAADIEERGQLEAITVRDCSTGIHTPACYYTVVFGHRRLAALQLLREQKRDALVRWSDEGLKDGTRRGAFMLRVSDEFPVKIQIVTMSDEEAFLANLAENAHKEGMRTVDVYARCDMLLRDGVAPEKVCGAAGIASATMTKRMSTFRRLSPEIVKRWQAIERPEHEPAWNFLADVARGKMTPGKRGGDPSTRLQPVTTAEQIAVWEKLFGGESGVVRLAEPAWRERQHLRPVREVKKKLKEIVSESGATNEATHYLDGVKNALEWVLGKDVEL